MKNSLIFEYAHTHNNHNLNTVMNMCPHLDYLYDNLIGMGHIEVLEDIINVLSGDDSFREDDKLIFLYSLLSEKEKLMDMLIDKGFDVNQKAPIGGRMINPDDNYLDLAIGRLSISMINYLIMKGANIDTLKKSSIINILQRNDTQNIIDLIPLQKLSSEDMADVITQCNIRFVPFVLNRSSYRLTEISSALSVTIPKNEFAQKFYDDRRFIIFDKLGLIIDYQIIMDQPTICAKLDVGTIEYALKNGAKPTGYNISNLIKLHGSEIIKLFGEYQIDMSSILFDSRDDDSFDELWKRLNVLCISENMMLKLLHIIHK